MKHIAITKQEINGSEVNSVKARDLYDSLGLDKSQFLRWSKKNILDNEFSKENTDYIVIDMMSNGKSINDYVLTIEFAKNLSMLARSKEGEATRQYFLKIEKQAGSELFAALEDQKHKIKSLLVSYDVMGEFVTSHEKRINNLEKNTRLESWQEKTLLDAKNRKVYELARNDDKLAKKLHGNIWREFKKRFHIPRYSELTIGRYDDGLTWLENVQLHEVV